MPARHLAQRAAAPSRGSAVHREARQREPWGDFRQASDIETGAPGFGRTQNGAAMSLPRPFCRKST
jgi:hypothetical protein